MNIETGWKILLLPACFGTLSFCASRESKKAPNPSHLLVGKWRVIKAKDSGTWNHTYECFADNTCIEKYDNEQYIGDVGQPPESYLAKWTQYKHYRFIGRNKFHMTTDKKILMNGFVLGEERLRAFWEDVYDVTITDNRAIAKDVRVKSVEEKKIDKIMEDAMDAAKKDVSGSNADSKPNGTTTPSEPAEIWLRVK
jgi:hypothetical protein